MARLKPRPDTNGTARTLTSAMMANSETWAERVIAGDRRAIARAISAVENQDETAIALVKLLFRRSRAALVAGITGAPGSGKSTLAGKLAAHYRESGLRVGIIAVDPTSPFSGGAILGDRVRMQDLAADDGVYIRSMATRGQLGGLAPATHDVVTVLEAAGCRIVLIETVGVGQDEVDVARLADVTLLLLVPGMGDEVQTFKAGVMEIADIFVINKADRPGADRLEQELTAMRAITPEREGWQPPVVKTVATTGEGVPALGQTLDRFQRFGQENRLALLRGRRKWRARLLELLRQMLLSRVVSRHLEDGLMDSRIEAILERRSDPHSVVEEMVAASMREG